MNINDIISKPTIFRDLKSSFALCEADGKITQIYTRFDSAEYMLRLFNNGSKIFEIVQNKQDIIANLGEIEVDLTEYPF